MVTNEISVDSGKIILIAKNEKCYGFVKMETLEGANDVIEKLNNTKINGQKVTIEKIISDPTLKAGQSEVTSSDSKVTSSDLRKASREKTPKKEEQKTSRKRSREKSNDTTKSSHSRQVTDNFKYFIMVSGIFLSHLKNFIFSEPRIVEKA